MLITVSGKQSRTYKGLMTVLIMVGVYYIEGNGSTNVVVWISYHIWDKLIFWFLEILK